jgi:hypothetical protein
VDEQRWQPGDVVFEEAFTGATRKLWGVRPAIVVDDNADYLHLYFPAGYTFYTADDLVPATPPDRTPIQSGTFSMIRPARYAFSLDERVRRYMNFAPRPQDYEEKTNTRYRVLYFEPHDAMHAVHVFWDPDWKVLNWYVNLQLPIRRTLTGIQTTDLYLDIALTADLQWSWKDEDEFEALCERGVFSAEERAAIYAEGEMMIERIDARQPPFDRDWGLWRPVPSWPVPKISDYVSLAQIDPSAGLRRTAG